MAFMRSFSNCHKRIWSTTVGGKIGVDFRRIGWACVVRYVMIWSAVMPAAMACWMDDFVRVAVNMLGKRVLRLAKRDRMEMLSGEDV